MNSLRNIAVIIFICLQLIVTAQQPSFENLKVEENPYLQFNDVIEYNGRVWFVTNEGVYQFLNDKFKTLLNNISGETIHQKIAIPDGEGLNFIKISDIIRFQSDGSYTYMHTIGTQKPTLISKPIGDYQEMLTTETFVRVHRSHLINLQHVSKYVKGEGGYAVMSDDSKVEVSRRKKGEFIEALSSL